MRTNEATVAAMRMRLKAMPCRISTPPGLFLALCWPGLAKYSRPANARVGRGGGGRRHTSGPAPAAAPGPGGYGAVMARPRRARACRPPHARARCGHLRPPDVGVLRALRHAGR